jgi:hypothetical protein
VDWESSSGDLAVLFRANLCVFVAKMIAEGNQPLILLVENPYHLPAGKGRSVAKSPVRGIPKLILVFFPKIVTFVGF